MGISLDYSTVDPVDPTTSAAIMEHVARIVGKRDWWCEPINFFESGENDGRLYGGNKIFLPGYSTGSGSYVEVDPDDDSFMAWRDTRFILDLLGEWSKQFGISWTVSCAGEPVGVVRNGSCDENIHQYMKLCEQAAGLNPADPAIEERANAISKQYASRW